MKKKLLVILGAGSSVERGLPSVVELDQHMSEWGSDWSAMHGIPDYYAVLKESVAAYYRTGPTGPRPALNFEIILGTMAALAHWMTPAPWGDPLRQAACDGALPPSLRFPNPSLPGHAPYSGTVMLADQLQHLLIELVRHMRRRCQTLNPLDRAARQYAALFDGLRQEFDLGVYNLNYDTTALSACPDAYTGFGDQGAFEAAAVHNRLEWRFVYHLHGSVHHCLVGQFGDEIRWKWDLSGAFFDGHQGLASDKRSDGRSFPKATLIAGGFKLDQLLVEPFHSLHAALVRHVYAADAILMGGYGFGDVHVNRALRNRLTTAENRPPVMVLDYAGAKTDPIAFREDFWAHEVCSTLSAGAGGFFEPGHASPPLISELVNEGAFEVSTPHRVAVWYGGFSEAATRVDRIVRWLRGDIDSFLSK